jgi:ribosomal protein L15E
MNKEELEKRVKEPEEQLSAQGQLKEEMNWRTKNGLIRTTDSLAFENRRKDLGISALKFTRIIDIP